MMKRILLTLLALLIAYLLFFPIKIKPMAWQPPDNKGFTGQFEENSILASTEIRFEESCLECESVHVDTANTIYGSSVTGDIWVYKQGREVGQILANTGGRPLGLQKDTLGNLLVVDSHKGLISIAVNGEISTLALTSDDDLAIGIADDLEIAEDGMVYFSDASWKFEIEGYKMDLLEHGPNGRLLSYNPATKETKTLLSDLYFANGIAVSHEQDFVLVVETGAYRVTRYWLKGAKVGTSDVLIDNLPGFPDGISQGENGIFWLAMVSPRDATLDATLPRPFIRKIIARLPDFLKPKPKNYACVFGINRDGEVLHNFQDPDGKFAQITCVTERNGKLYFGSLGRNGVGVFDLE